MVLRNMYTLRDGYSELVDLAARNSTVLLQREVLSITQHEVGCSVRVRGIDGSVAEIDAAGVVCAVPATRVGELLGDAIGVRRSFIDSVRYSATVTMVCGIRHDRTPADRAVLYPVLENTYLAAKTSTMRCDGLEDSKIVKIHASGVVAPHLMQKSDSEIASVLQRAAGLAVGPPDLVFQQIFRWPEALPEFDPGYLTRLSRFEQQDGKSDRVTYAGDYLGGPFVEGAIGSGQHAADRLASRIAL